MAKISSKPLQDFSREALQGLCDKTFQAVWCATSSVRKIAPHIRRAEQRRLLGQLSELLKSESVSVRKTAVITMGRSQPPSAFLRNLLFESIVEAMRDYDSGVRHEALAALEDFCRRNSGYCRRAERLTQDALSDASSFVVIKARHTQGILSVLK
ncbi:MAG: HEAT repeat domain-containing protein [bacterium]|nr:HEAT repeat domain-containing protein [bacterium]